jgi:hypothetical protein
MPHIRVDNQPVTQITVIEPEPGKQAESLSLMTEGRATANGQNRPPSERGNPGHG